MVHLHDIEHPVQLASSTYVSVSEPWGSLLPLGQSQYILDREVRVHQHILSLEHYREFALERGTNYPHRMIGRLWIQLT
jgi:hypothetical protein